MSFEAINKIIKTKMLHIAAFLKSFFHWTLIATLIGVICAFLGAAFHISIDIATQLRTQHPQIIYFLPLAGVLIVWLYHITNMKKHKGTDNIIQSVRGQERVPLRTAPLIFVSTIITHLFGGSAGREGAALQLGGSIGYKIAELFKFRKKDRTIVVMCGMSAFFSSLFGTPLTAAIFAIEVTSVGIMHYSALIPCTIASLTAYSIAKIIGVHYSMYRYILAPFVNITSILQVALIAMLCAAISVLFCMLLHGGTALAKKKIKNEYLRIIIGGCVIVILTMLAGTYDYNGAGSNIIEAATRGIANPEAFILKMLFTVVTISVGFKGGEIVPTFFVGATFGCFFASLIGLTPQFGAAVGMVAMFCGMLNCPVASIILSIEMFGDQGLILFAVASGISYMLSGYYGLYHSQKIVYSKTRAKYINVDTK